MDKSLYTWLFIIGSPRAVYTISDDNNTYSSSAPRKDSYQHAGVAAILLLGNRKSTYIYSNVADKCQHVSSIPQARYNLSALSKDPISNKVFKNGL